MLNPLPEQGGFDERLDEVLTKLARETTLADRDADIAATPQGVKDASKRYQWSISEARSAIRTLVLEEIIGEDETDEDEELNTLFYGTRNGLRLQQRKELEDTHGTK